MFQNNPLLVQLKKKLHSKIPRIEGIIKSSERGFGFLEIDSQKSYFIPPKNMKKVMHGDRITAILKIEQNREIIEPEELIDPFLKKFVGKIQIKSNQIFVIPDFPLLKNLIKCDNLKKLSHKFQDGDWVLAQLTKHKLKGHQFFSAELIDLIATEKGNFYPWLVTLTTNNLEKTPPVLFSKEEIKFNNLISRIDLTHLDFITIDALTTKDIDDAVYIEKKNNGLFTVNVAIADPSAFISHNSRLDCIARERSFTNYLPGFTIPMLPNELSEDICSLLPNVRRPALICKFDLATNGGIVEDSILFFLGWIQSKEKLVYEQVSDWIEKKITWKPKKKSIQKQIILLHQVYKMRFLWRKKYSLIFKDKPEYKFHFSKDYEVLDITIESRRIAHRMIEESMIAANICAAKFLSKHLGYGIFNIHKGFQDTFNAEQAVTILEKYKINCNVQEIMTLNGFCNMHRKLNILSNNYLNSRIRKLQSFGEINIYPCSHFLLGLEMYATWTSPIRKYSDIINHRLLKSIIQNQPSIKLNHEILNNINEKKRKYRIVQRDIEDWLYILYFNHKNTNDNCYYAEIIDIFKSGVRAKLVNNGANVFIPATFLHLLKEELLLDKEKGQVYIKNQLIYKITDLIQVILIDVKQSTRNIIAKPKLLSVS